MPALLVRARRDYDMVSIHAVLECVREAHAGSASGLKVLLYAMAQCAVQFSFRYRTMNFSEKYCDMPWFCRFLYLSLTQTMAPDSGTTMLT